MLLFVIISIGAAILIVGMIPPHSEILQDWDLPLLLPVV